MLIDLLKRRVQRLLGRLADAARTDPLTGLHNRRGFEESIEVELERARRGDHALSLLLGDLDHFKRVNDRFGHAARRRRADGRSADPARGQARRSTTRRGSAARSSRSSCPRRPSTGRLLLAERLRTAVQEAFADEPVPLTFSFGDRRLSAPRRDAPTPAARRRPGALRGQGARPQPDGHLHRPRSIDVDAGDGADGARRDAPRHPARRSPRRSTCATPARLDHSQTVGPLRRAHRARARPVDRTASSASASPGCCTTSARSACRTRSSASPARSTRRSGRRCAGTRRSARASSRPASFDDIRDWIVAHHERPDGRGYPHGLSDDEIPLEAKILAVADAYEAMTSDRVYRGRARRDAARAELRGNAGAQFDARVVEAFLAVVDRASDALTATAR